MNCEEFETLLVDALGGELAPADESVFQAHVAQCERCRVEYETTRAAVDTMRSLPGPQRVRVERRGQRLILHDPAPPRRSGVSRLAGSAVFRYAASVMIAFVGGYALHAGLMLADAAGGTQVVRLDPKHGSAIADEPSFQTALITAHWRNPKQPDLAKCMVAMFGSARSN
ncbi:MAG: zf-HC2 domain-containing protein [Planctomycetes bacterium]|nr:zf-HC2 domain-containing protein [Planctomycetota bacterium]